MPKLKWTKNGARIRVVIFLLACSVFLVVHQHKSISQLFVRPNTYTSSHIFTSPKDGFSVQFPSNPTIENYTLILKHGSPDSTATATLYKSATAYVLYQVLVTQFPSSFEGGGTDENLKLALDGIIKDPKKMKIIASSFTLYRGYRTINGDIEVKSADGTHYIFAMIFLKGHTLYSLQTIDALDGEVSSFTSSFLLNEKDSHYP